MIPLFWPLVSFIIGILATPFLDPSSVWLCLPLAILLAFVRYWGLLLTFALLGAGVTSFQPPVPPDPGDFPVRLVGTLTGPPEWRGPGVYLDIRLLAIDARPYRGGVRLTEFLDDLELRPMFDGLDLGSGDRLEIVVKLHRPALYRDPGVPDFRRYLERQHIYWTGTIRNPRLITILDRGWHGPDRLKRWIYGRLQGPFEDNPSAAGLLMAMVFGRTYGLSARIERQFQAAGIYHLIVVAGFHLAVVMGIAFWIARRILWWRDVQLLFVFLSVIGYSALTNGHVPVTRAALMVGFLVVSKLLDRGYSIGNSLAGAALIILLVDPQSIQDASFQMTFAAVGAVVGMGVPAINWAFGWLREALTQFDDSERDGRLSPEIADWRVARRLWCELHGLPTWVMTLPWRALQKLGEIATISLCVQCVFVVFMVESFHRISPIAPLLNIPAGLAATVVIPLAFLTAVLPARLAHVCAWILTSILRVLLAVVDFGLSLPGANLRVPSAPVWLWLAYGIVLTGLIWAIRARRLSLFLSSAAAVISVQAAIALADLPASPPPVPTITFLDVGQGDAIFIQFPDGKKMLVDGGGVTAGRFLGLRDESTFSIGENVVSPFLWSQGIRKLDVVVLTHAHNDHLDGLLDVVENFRVGQLWLGRNSVNSAFRELLRRAMSRQIPIRWVTRGDVIPVSGSGSSFPRFNVLHPPSNWRPRPNDQNDDSVVLLLDTGEVTALLTGDITRKIAVPESVDVYKVAHHGSKGVKLQVHAPIRVISVGANNPFGHPDPSTLPAFRTDQLGAITVTLANHPPAVRH